MKQRYNPHKQQKELKKQNLFTDLDLSLGADIVKKALKAYENGIYPLQIQNYKHSLFIDELAREYGYDTVRFAEILFGLTNNLKQTEHNFEICYKWLSLFYYNFVNDFKSSNNKKFNAKVWLKAIEEVKRFIFEKHKYNLALARLKNAVKLTLPCSCLNMHERKFILLALYPFMPVMSSYLLLQIQQPENKINESLKTVAEQNYNDLICVKFAIKGQYKYIEVFEKYNFKADPKQCFKQLKWLVRTLNNKDFNVLKEQKGYRICLKM